MIAKAAAACRVALAMSCIGLAPAAARAQIGGSGSIQGTVTTFS